METTICIGIIMHSVMLFFSLLVFVFYKKNDYFRFGPHKDLTLININVDTQDIYIATIIVLSLLRFTHILVTRLGYLYIDSVRQYSNSTTNKSFWISTMINYVRSLSFFILIKAFITQFDFAIVSIVFSEVLFIPFNYYSIHKHNHSKREKPVNIMDITNINPVFSPPKLRFGHVYEDTE